MPIEVRHDSTDPALDAAIALALNLVPPQPQFPGQQQVPQPGQPPIQDAADLLSQLAPLARGNAQAPAPQAAPSYQAPQASYLGVRAPRGGGQDVLDSYTGQGLGYDKLANQDYLAQEREAGREQRQLERERQQGALAIQREAAQQQPDIPVWIQQGIANNTLKYDPANRRQRDMAQSAITQIINEPFWTPEQKAQFIAQRKQEIRQLDLSPQEVPLDQRPIPPEQQYQNSLIMRPVQLDENTTLNLPVVPFMRNGEMQYKLSPEGEITAKIAMEKLKHQQVMQQKLLDRQNREADQQAKEAQRQETVNRQKRNALISRQDRLSAERHAALEELWSAANLRDQIASGQSLSDKSGAPLTKEQVGLKMDNAQRRLDELDNELLGINNELNPSDTGQKTHWYDNIQPGQTYTAPDGSIRTKQGPPSDVQTATEDMGMPANTFDTGVGQQPPPDDNLG